MSRRESLPYLVVDREDDRPAGLRDRVCDGPACLPRSGEVCRRQRGSGEEHDVET